MPVNYLKIGRAADLSGWERKAYRALEILPAFLSWLTIIVLSVMSYFQPVWVALFLIAFDVYWLLLVLWLVIHLLYSYRKLRSNAAIDWPARCEALDTAKLSCDWRQLIQLVIMPSYNEGLDILEATLSNILADSWPADRLIVVVALEERAGPAARERGAALLAKYGDQFGHFLVTYHPDGVAGEIKGKGSNQAYAARRVKAEVIDREGLDPRLIVVNVIDSDTMFRYGYFHCLAWNFATATDPWHASFQPVPVYHNNLWQAPFFARVAASSNTFWQMMQQVRPEKLATYSSHAMSWQALEEIDFWSTNMVSEDSRIFWHCFLHYRGDYRVIPLYFPVSMDVCMDRGVLPTARNLYKQQRRWGWGVENIPYLVFNTVRLWRELPKGVFVKRILVQFYGFHSWATNAIVIGVIGWLPLFVGGERFNTTVLSGNLPNISRSLMILAMIGMVTSAVVSTLLLPPRPAGVSRFRRFLIPFEWIVLPVSILLFGAIPGLEAQTRLALGKHLGFWVTPKER